MNRFLRGLTVACAAFAVGGSGLLHGQAGTPAGTDRASAYYHAALGHLYAELTALYGGRGEYLAKAIENYKQAIKADPSTSYLPQELADIYIQSGQARTAVSEYEELVKRNPNDLNSRRILARFYTARINTGNQQRLNGDMLNSAIEQYQAISAGAPDDFENWMMLGRLQKVANKPAVAKNAFKRATEIDPESEDALTGLAMVYNDEGDNENASLILKRLADKNPSPRTLKELAASYEQMKDFKSAAEAYRRALDLNREDTDVKRAYGDALFRADDLDQALKVFGEILTEDKSDVAAALRISQIYRQKRDFGKAEEYAAKAVELDPANLDAQFNSVSLLETEGKNADAIKALKDVIAGLPRKPAGPGEKNNRMFLLDQLGRLYRGNDQTDLAVAAYREIIDLDPDAGARAGALIVETYRQAKEYAAAGREAQAFATRYPDDRLIKLMTANIQADLGQAKEAEATLKSLMDGKNDRENWISLSQVYEKSKNWTAMNEAIDQAAKLSTTSEEKEGVLFLRGAMYERMKKFDLAEAEFRKVLAMNPASPSTLNYLGYMLADRNVRLNEALEMLKKAVDQEPANSAFLDSLGWVYFRLNKLEDAEDTLRRALQPGVRDATVFDHLGDVCFGRNKLKDAIKQWERSLKEWQTAAPSENDPAEVAKIQKKLEKARVRLAQEHSPAKHEQ